MTSVKVAVRVRPLNKRELDMNSKSIIQMNGKKTTIINTKLGESHLEGVSESTREAMRVKDFSFDFSFWTVDRNNKEKYDDQEKVYQGLGVDVVQSGFEGYNACVFAYGQTGSGKTYTMMGPPDDIGLIPRICQELFHRMTDDTMSYRTEVCYLEIYNEKVRDLLKTTTSGAVVHNLRVREHPKEGPYVQGLSKYIVGSYDEIEALMKKGNSVRTTASTNMNDVSSRSHAIFTIVFTQATIKDGIPSEKTSKIHLVDLAGSERATSTGATGVRLREGGSINKSLVSLGTVIKQLAEASDKTGKPGKGGNFIPYRDSVLTWLLKDSLGGNSRTIMVTTISPADVNYAESLSALRYANRAKNIINRPTVNEDRNVKIIRELKEEIERLKAMVGGDIDSISGPKVKERLHESEARMKVLTEEWSEKWKDIASILKEQDTLALRKEGLGVVLDSALPHLIGIDDDILSTGIMLFHLKEGKTCIGSSEGSDPPVDIVIAGLEVESNHCTLENNNSCVTLIPTEGALCAVNGNLVTETTKLTQGAVILLGKTNMFRYNNPAEAAQMKKELKKTGMTFSLSRTSLISQSMTDLYRSSENLSASNGWELDNSHREEQERIEELRTQILVLEDRYHAEEEERLNQQVSMEMALEKKQNQLSKAYKELEKIQQNIIQNHQGDGIMMKLPKGSQIDDLLKKLDDKETLINDMARETRDKLHEKMESLRSANEARKEDVVRGLADIQDKCTMKEREVTLLHDELDLKKQAAQEQDVEDQKVIDIEQQQLDKMRQDFDVIFQGILDGDESLQGQWHDIEGTRCEMVAKFESTELEMKERWKKDVDSIAKENKDIEEALSEMEEQNSQYDEMLESSTLTDKERDDIVYNKEQLREYRVILKTEENKVAVKEQKILDNIEIEMDRWEQYKKEEEVKIDKQKKELVKDIGNNDLNQRNSKIEEKEAHIAEITVELAKQDESFADFEKNIEEKKGVLLEEKETLIKEKESINESQCKAVIKLEGEIITINEELNNLDAKLADDLNEIKEERNSLLLLKKSEQMSDSGIECSDLEEKLRLIPLSQEEQAKIDTKQKEVTELQQLVEHVNEDLDQKVHLFDQARDYELDVLELEKVNLQERVRQDRINALVEQEVKRRMFEEKLQREQKRQHERDREKREREEEIKRLKEAHLREIKQLKAKYEKNAKSGPVVQGKSITPTQSNPYVTVMSADSEGDTPRRKSTGNLSNHLESDPPATINITLPMYRLQSYGSDSHYEYEVKIVVGDDVWSIMRRYSKFREFHQTMKNKIPEIGALVFPPKKLFSKNEKTATERRKQLEFYLRSVIEICSKCPATYLHPSKNKFLSKQVLCQFDPFFRKGLFESSKYGTT